MSEELNDQGGERGRCWECGYLLDKCMSFLKEDTRDIVCPKCGVRTYQGAWYPKSFQKAKEEYQNTLSNKGKDQS